MPTQSSQRYALISVANKQGMVELAGALHKCGVALLATGRSAELLQENRLPVTSVSELTGFPEIMDGRVKTLHPKIHGGLLGRAGIDDTVMQAQNIPFIDFVIVNLYPFAKTIEQADCTLEQAVEQIDIGGPTLLRAAAKNFNRVTAVIDPADYPLIIDELQQHGHTHMHTRRQLAVKVFQQVSHYNALISHYLANHAKPSSPSTTALFPEDYTIHLHKAMDLRYGENPQQQAALYTVKNAQASLAHAKPVQGKPLSFNNLLDSACAWSTVNAFTEKPACVIVKHATPCGVAIAPTVLEAYQRAYRCDQQSAFGGIIAINQALTVELVSHILQTQFVEVIIAPTADKTSIQALAKKPNVRLLLVPTETNSPGLQAHDLPGGLLLQTTDTLSLDTSPWQVVTQQQPTAEQRNDLAFAWAVVKSVKSNAIVYAHQQMTVGIGSGQTSRIFAAQIAAEKAQQAELSLTDAVMASDAFFPFADCVSLAKQLGIKAIVQPGGSRRDPEVIQAANDAGLCMLFTGQRHFRH